MNPQKILAIKLRALGDTVLTTAPLIELKRAFPQSEIHLLTPTEWAPLLSGFPGIQKIWHYDRKSSKIARARAMAQLANSLRRERFDGVINFHASPSSSLLAYATGASIRAIHFHGHHHRDRFSTVRIPGKGTLKPILERDMDTLRALGVHVPAGRLPSLPLQDSEIRTAIEILNHLGLGFPLLAIHLGASRETKTWPLQRWADLAVQWVKNQSGFVLALTGPKEDALRRSFLSSLDEQLTLTLATGSDRSAIRQRIGTLHSPPLRTLAALLGRAAVWAGSDSGPKHLAIAVGTPTVTLFGPEDPFEWHPYPLEKNPYLFRQELSCRLDADPGMPPWCGLNECKTEENRCMKLIGVDSVFAQCKKIAKG
jgi:hypothetical protein